MADKVATYSSYKKLEDHLNVQKINTKPKTNAGK